MRNLIESLDQKSPKTRLMYFWIGVTISFVFSVGILVFSLSGVLGKLEERRMTEQQADELGNLPSLAESAKGLWGDAKELMKRFKE